MSIGKLASCFVQLLGSHGLAGVQGATYGLRTRRRGIINLNSRHLKLLVDPCLPWRS